MKSLALLPVLLLSLATASLAFNCPENQRYDHESDVDGEALYAFTSQVVEAVRDRDVERLVGFFDGDLRDGPRKRDILKKGFTNIFPERCRDEILEDGPTCSWESRYDGAYMGSMWIGKKDGPDSFYIRSINDWFPEERDSTLPTGWTVDGNILKPDCFVRDWADSSNLDILSEVTGVPLSELQGDIGTLLVKLPYSTPSPWNDEDDEFPPIRAVAKVSECCDRLPDPLPQKEAEGYGAYQDGMAIFYIKEEYYMELDHFLIMKKIPTDLCQSLAPGFSAQCMESYLVRIMENGGGTQSIITIGAYGLFIDAQGDKLIAPLKYFEYENEGLNFIDDHSAP